MSTMRRKSRLCAPILTLYFPGRFVSAHGPSSGGGTVRTLPSAQVLALLAFIPAVLALAFLVSGLGMWAHRQQYQSGVLKALGWTNADLMRLSLVRGVLVGLPAAICGSGCAYFLLYAPGVTWISQRLYGWPTTGTAWYLNPGAVAAGLLPGLLLVGLPYLLAVVWSAWQSIKTDPANALQER